jgi:GntR family transcriptional regulator
MYKRNMCAVPSKKRRAEEGFITPSTNVCTPEYGKTSFERLHIRLSQTGLLVHQIVRQIVDACAMGALSPEERLPTIGDAAKQIGVSPSTIRDVYHMLTLHGIASTTQNRGTYLTRTTERAACRYQLSYNVRELIIKARALHLADEEIVAVVLTELSAKSADTTNETGTFSPDDMR